MKAVQNCSLRVKSIDQTPVCAQSAQSLLNNETIRLRVRNIRSSWSPEEKRMRKLEGIVRRGRLESLLFGRCNDEWQSSQATAKGGAN